MLGIRKRNTLNLLSLLVSFICVSALFIGEMGAGLMFFFIGLLVWFIALLFRTPRSELTQFVLPISLASLVLWVVLPGGTFRRLVSIIIETPQSGVGLRVPVYLDCLQLITESPLAGIGLGNFSAVFPQYRIFSRSPSAVDYPQSDFLWFLAEGGLISILGVAFCLYGFFKISRERKSGSNLRFRRIVFLGAGLFFVHALIATPAHHVGPMYMALLFAALAVPRGPLKQNRLSSRWWRLAGSILVLNGLFWVAGDALRLGVHSLTIRQQAAKQMSLATSGNLIEEADFPFEKALRRNPMDWEFHHQRGKWALAAYADSDMAMSDFKRAAFCEPWLSKVRFEEGLQWMQYDLSRTSAAWLNALYRISEDRVAMFRAMLEGASENPLMMDRLKRLSYFDSVYRREYLLSKEGAQLLKEMIHDFSAYPSLSNYSKEDRSAVVSHWLKYAKIEEVDAYMSRYCEDLKDPWYVKAQLLTRKSDFFGAVELVVQNIQHFELETSETMGKDLARLERSYDVLPGDLTRGLDLLGLYLANEDLKKALDLIESLIETEADFLELYYWRAEVLRRMGDFYSSWYAFTDYLSR
jgi:tetratricopeptide (TPR) repeat protein